MALLLNPTLAVRSVLSTMADYFPRPRESPAAEPEEFFRYGDICIGHRMIPAISDTYNTQTNRRLDDIFKYILPRAFPEPGAISASYTHYTGNPTSTIRIASSREPFQLTCDSDGYIHVTVPVYATNHMRVHPQVETLA